MSDYFFTKYSAEVDPVDLFVYFGLIGSLVAYLFLFITMLPAFSVFKSDKLFPPVIVLVNIILVMLAFFSGHILNSGMLGLLWGLFNSLVFVKPVAQSRNECSV